MKVLTIGGATQDVFILHKCLETALLETTAGKRSFLLLEEGKKIEVKDIDYHTGGGATNSATALKQLGFDAIPFCKIGSDQQADFIIDDLQARGLSTELLLQSSSTPTSVSFIIPCPSGDRTVLV